MRIRCGFLSHVSRRFKRPCSRALLSPSIKSIQLVYQTVNSVMHALYPKASMRWLLPLWKTFHKGKTHLSIAIGLEAVYAGYKVCFERMTNLVKLLKSAEVQRTSALRLNRIFKSHGLVIDEIGYTPIERKEANFFFNLVSEIYEKSSIVITSNTSFNEWAELLGDEVLTTALLDRLLHQAHTGPSIPAAGKKHSPYNIRAAFNRFP